MGTEDVVQLVESTFSPDDESTDVSSRSQLKQVKSAHVDGLNTGDVSEGSDEGDVVAAVDDERSSSGSVSSVSELSETGSNLNGAGNLLHIIKGTNVSKESDGFLSSLDSFGRVVDNKREFRDLVNSVSSGLHKGQDGGGSKSSGNGEFSLLKV